MPRTAKVLPKQPLSQSEIETVLNQPDINDIVGLRDRALLETIYSTGMRRMEVINLQIEDIYTERKVVIIKEGKGKKDRMAPIGERALQWIEKYLEQSRPELVFSFSEQTLFLSSYGEALTGDYLTQLVRRYIKSADIGKSGSCHLFRHSCATHMLENGADIRFIQQLLGHENISTTQIYTNVSIKQLQKVHAMTHPSAKNKA